MKTYMKKIGLYLLPFALTWFYVCSLYLFCVATAFKKIGIVTLTGMAVFLILEHIIDNYYRYRKYFGSINSLSVLKFSARSACVLAVCLLFRISYNSSDNQFAEFLAFSHAYHFSILWITFLSSEKLFSAAALLWLGLYHYFVVKKKKFRVTVIFVFPVLLFFSLSKYFYITGGDGAVKDDSISVQKSVSFVFKPENFPRRDFNHWNKWNSEWHLHPRDIIYLASSNSLYALYSNTYSEDDSQGPVLIKIDLSGGKVDYFYSFRARHICPSDNGLLISNWYTGKLFELSPDLKLLRSIELQYDRYPYKVRTILYDKESSSVFITYDMDRKLQSYDYISGKLKDSVSLDIAPNNKTVELWQAVLWPGRDRIYMSAQGSPSADLLEINSNDLSITNKLDAGITEFSEIQLDTVSDMLYCQSWGSPKLLEISLEDLKIHKEMKGETHARSIILDRPRGKIYLLSYFHGKFIVMDQVSGKKESEIKVGAEPYSMLMLGDTVYVSSQNGIIAIDLEELIQKDE